MPKVTLKVNGTPVSAEVEGRTLLVDLLRDGCASPAPMWAVTPASAAPARFMSMGAR